MRYYNESMYELSLICVYEVLPLMKVWKFECYSWIDEIIVKFDDGIAMVKVLVIWIDDELMN